MVVMLGLLTLDHANGVLAELCVVSRQAAPHALQGDLVLLVVQRHQQNLGFGIELFPARLGALGGIDLFQLESHESSSRHAIKRTTPGGVYPERPKVMRVKR